MFEEPEITEEDILHRVTEELTRQGMRRYELAKAIKLDGSALSNLLHGKRLLRYTWLKRIANALGFTVEDFLRKTRMNRRR